MSAAVRLNSFDEAKRDCRLWAEYRDNRLDRQVDLGYRQSRVRPATSADSPREASPSELIGAYLRVNKALCRAFPAREFAAAEAFLYARHASVAPVTRGPVWDERRAVLARAGFTPRQAVDKVYESL